MTGVRTNPIPAMNDEKDPGRPGSSATGLIALRRNNVYTLPRVALPSALVPVQRCRSKGLFPAGPGSYIRCCVSGKILDSEEER